MKQCHSCRKHRKTKNGLCKNCRKEDKVPVENTITGTIN